MVMVRKPKLDPRTVKLQAEYDELAVKAQRWWRRLRRAVNALEKCHRRAATLKRRLDNPD
jgi:hypothetical protein